MTDAPDMFERFWSKVQKTEKCWNWTAAKCQGYGRIIVNSRLEIAHRVSWRMANGEIPNGMLVLHHCDNPSCVRPDHLFLGTDADNVADKVRKNRHTKGETHCSSKLSNREVEHIKRLYELGFLQRDIGKVYGIVQQHVSDIVNGKKWRHLDA